jgi:hypothetical protein
MVLLSVLLPSKYKLKYFCNICEWHIGSGIFGAVKALKHVNLYHPGFDKSMTDDGDAITVRCYHAGGRINERDNGDPR